MTWHERLTALDALFLQLEDDTAHMHVGAVSIYEGQPPAYSDLLALVASRLDHVPRYRQRLAFGPFGLGRPAWIDEPHLDLEYHVRHTALPPPGGEEPLKRLAGRLFAQRLDRDKPLWELWLVEGLGGNRFATLSKVHHCMIDGAAGMELTAALHDRLPGAEEPPPGRPWSPRPPPSGAALAAASIRARLGQPLELAREAFDPCAAGGRTVREIAGGLGPLLRMSRMGQAPRCSLNQPIGPHRRWEMTTLGLAAVKSVGAAAGGTVNDVVLAVVAGALRRLLKARGEPAQGDLRVLVPVNVRGREAAGTSGNRVAAVFCPLPADEPDPAARLRKVIEATQRVKESRQLVGALALTHLRELAPTALAARAARLDAVTRWFNLVVTNVRGPPGPLHLLGRRLVACHPAIPLARAQTLGVALLSHGGSIDVGLLGDADRMRDLPLLARGIPEALSELIGAVAAARGTPPTATATRSA